MFSKLKQFKEGRHIQKELSHETGEGSGAWGKVKVTMNGNLQLTAVTIDPSLLSQKEKLEGGVKDAVNEAAMKMLRVMATKAQGMMKGKEPGDRSA